MQKRPVFLNLFLIKFPLTAIVSIGHRISGVLLFLSIPVLLLALDNSLSSEFYFATVKDYIMSVYGKYTHFAIIAFLYYHLLAGIRHLIMDCGVGESKQQSRFSAILIFLLFIAGMALGWMWLFKW